VKYKDVQFGFKNREIKIGNRPFEDVSHFMYLGMTVTDQNLIQEEIKRRLNSGPFGPEPFVLSPAVKICEG
jgi:hypothetical protein